MVVFAVMVHENPVALRCLLKSLVDQFVVVHIDKKVSREKYLIELGPISEKVFIVPFEQSIYVNWGGFSQSMAQKTLMDYSLRHTPASYIVFLSGTCFPIRPISTFIEFLSQQSPENLIQVRELNRLEVNRPKARYRDIRRVKRVHFRDLRVAEFIDRVKTLRRLRNILFRFLESIPFRNSGFSQSRRYFIGSHHIAISRQTAVSIVQNWDILSSEFKRSFGPDEMLIQTHFARINEKLRYDFQDTDTSNILNAPFHFLHPSLRHRWEIHDLPVIMNSKKFFIRKPSLELIEYLQSEAPDMFGPISDEQCN